VTDREAHGAGPASESRGPDLEGNRSDPGAYTKWYLEEQLDIDRRVIEFCFQTLQPHLKGPRGLELGPAEGQMTRLLVTAFERLTVVDAAPELLALIPDSPNLVKVQSLFEQFQAAETYDTILLMQTLAVLRDPVWHLRRFGQWLGPGGRFVVAVPNAHSLHRLAAVKMGLLEDPGDLSDRDRATGNLRVYTPESFRDVLVSAGFRIDSMEGIFLKPLSNSQIQESWTDEMISAFLKLGREFPDISALTLAVCGRD
jgi:trans-aconitate methyltransferase